MRVILILFLILFIIISSLFLTTFQINSSGQDLELTEEELAKDESISIIPDTKPDTISEAQGLENPSQDEMGTIDPDTLESEDDQIALSEIQDIEEEQDDEGQNGVEQNETITEQSSTRDSEDPEQDTIKIYLDGNMENGIYLGAATYGISSSRALELYGSTLADTGFKFEWEITDLELEPGSTHFLYIYYYNTESGWDHIREEINITGHKPGDANIKIFIDEPVEQKVVEDLTGIRGWALDIASSDNTGIGKVRIYLDGPMNFGQQLGDVDNSLEMLIMEYRAAVL